LDEVTLNGVVWMLALAVTVLVRSAVEDRNDVNDSTVLRYEALDKIEEDVKINDDEEDLLGPGLYFPYPSWDEISRQ
jgi:hypothetical protein